MTQLPSPAFHNVTVDQLTGGTLTGTLTGTASASLALASLGTTLRSLSSRFSDRMDVRDFGVVGSGEDELALLQAAVDAAAGRAVLQIPAGMSIGISNQLLLRSGTQLELNGELRLLDAAFSSTIYVVQIIGSGVRLTGSGIIDGNASGMTGTGAAGGIGSSTPETNQTITALSWAGGIATAGYSGTAPIPGASITINGCTPAGWNGTVEVISVAGGSFTYAMGMNPGPATVLGTYNILGISNVYIGGITSQNCKNWPYNFIGTNCVAELCSFLNSGNSAEYSHSSQCYFLRCTTSGIADDGIGLYGACTDCGVIGCFTTDCLTGAFILSDSAQTTPCTNCQLIENTSRDTSAAGFLISSGFAASPHVNIIVEGNNSSHSVPESIPQQSDFRINNVSGLLMTGNIGGGMTGSEPSYCLIVTGVSINSKISGNIFGGGSATGQCVIITSTLAQTSDLEFSDNMFIASGSGTVIGVLVQDNTNTQITMRNNKPVGAFSTAAYSNINQTMFEGNTSSGVTNEKIFTQRITTPLLRIGVVNPVGNVGPTDPTFTTGTGVPTGTQPPSSLYLRQDGALGTYLYVSSGAGTWSAIG